MVVLTFALNQQQALNTIFDSSAPMDVRQNFAEMLSRSGYMSHISGQGYVPPDQAAEGFIHTLSQSGQPFDADAIREAAAQAMGARAALPHIDPTPAASYTPSVDPSPTIDSAVQASPQAPQGPLDQMVAGIQGVGGEIVEGAQDFFQYFAENRWAQVAAVVITAGTIGTFMYVRHRRRKNSKK